MCYNKRGVLLDSNERAPQTTTHFLPSGFVGRARRGIGRMRSCTASAFYYPGHAASPLGTGGGTGAKRPLGATTSAAKSRKRSPRAPRHKLDCSPRAVTVCAATRSKPSPTAGTARPLARGRAATPPARRTPPHEVAARRGNTERPTTKRRQGTAPRQFRNNRPILRRAVAPTRARQAERIIGRNALLRKMQVLRNREKCRKRSILFSGGYFTIVQAEYL